jgi:hypothetical protein
MGVFMNDAIGAVALLKRSCHRPISRQARTPSAARTALPALSVDLTDSFPVQWATRAAQAQDVKSPLGKGATRFSPC